MRLHLKPALAAAALAVASLGAHAGLFDDDEARRAILDMRASIKASDDNARARIAELQSTNAQLLDQVQQMRRSLLDLNAQLETMRSDVARLRGQNEELARVTSDVQRSQKDIAQGVDERMRRIEPQQVTLDGKQFNAEPDEKKAYDDAIAQLRTGDFPAASAALASFVKRYPASGYGESARFWLGNAQYGQRDYRQAIATFRGFVAAAPDSPRAPEAMLALANSQLEMKDGKSARSTLNELMRVYPKSEAALAARERLASLK